LKQLGRRLGLWLLVAALLVLADEWLKESYLFRPSDLLVPFSHEQVFAALLAAFGAWLITVLKGTGRDKT